ncbi:TRAP C4-dicarboxylate transporter [Phormidium willei BDU 130791]|nr:TRAP C4-dicarboxylate transporter [Phormidium willei BDU 130791]
MRRRLERLLDGIEDVSMIVFMAAAILVTFVQVVMRYGFNASLYWGEEVVLYSIICMSFVGVSMGLRYGAHISVDILKAFVGERYATALFLTSSALGIVFALALLLLGGELFLSTLARGQLSPALRIPVAWVYFAIPFSGATLLLRYALLLRRLWAGEPLFAEAQSSGSM